MIFVVFVHAADAILHDHSDFIREGRIVALAGGNNARQNLAMPVVMLQSFAEQRGSARRAANQKALSPRIGKRPDQIARPAGIRTSSSK